PGPGPAGLSLHPAASGRASRATRRSRERMDREGWGTPGDPARRQGGRRPSAAVSPIWRISAPPPPSAADVAEHGLRPAPDVELLVDPPDVAPHGLRADEQGLADLPGAVPLRQ